MIVWLLDDYCQFLLLEYVVYSQDWGVDGEEDDT